MLFREAAGLQTNVVHWNQLHLVGSKIASNELRGSGFAVQILGIRQEHRGWGTSVSPQHNYKTCINPVRILVGGD